MHTRWMKAILALSVVLVAVGAVPVLPETAVLQTSAYADNHCQGSSCPIEFERDVEAQMNALNTGTGRPGGSPPIPCDASNWVEQRPGTWTHGDDTPPEEEWVGVVQWEFARAHPYIVEGLRPGEETRDGAWFQRWCVYPDGTRDAYPLGFDCPALWPLYFIPADGVCHFAAIDPEQLAVYLLDQLREVIPPPEPHFAPEDTTVVNIDTYLWVEGTEDETEIPPQTAAVPGIEITLEAKRGDFVWEMGDGEQETCEEPGIDPGAEIGNGTCYHSYERSSAGESGDVFEGEVSIEWTGVYHGTQGGEAIPETDLEVDVQTAGTPFEIAVAEGQTIVVN